MSDAPRLFVSYSHDDQAHKDWVLSLSYRLVANGVDAVLDQWDMTLGGDLPRFMENGLVDADRVLAICSSSYVKKANQGLGGTGYEKMILTGQLMKNLTSDRIIPVIRNNTTENPLPTFLESKLFVDFRNDATFEEKYADLLRNIHGHPITPRPQLGPNPFIESIPDIEPRTAYSHTRYVSPALVGEVTFDYSNNNGRYVLGAGDMLFETAWSRGGSTSVHAYSDPPSIRNLALAIGVSKISEIKNARLFDTSSRVRSPHLNEIVVWENTEGYFLATQICSIKSRGHEASVDEIVFRYRIMPKRGFDFTKFRNERFTAEEIVGADSDPKTDALWQANWPIEHFDDFDKKIVQVTPIEQFRAWLRVIPQCFDNNIPRICEVNAVVPDALRLRAPSTRLPGFRSRLPDHGYGACDFGFVVYWYFNEGNGDTRQAHSLAAFLERTGEIWMSDGGAFMGDKDGIEINYNSLLSNWIEGLKNAMTLLDHLHASSHRRIIAGIEGLKEAFWRQQDHGARYFTPIPSRRLQVGYEETKCSWSGDELQMFLMTVWNDLRDAYGRRPLTEEEFAKYYKERS